MTKTQYYTATSLDGYIADPDHSLDWLFEAAAATPTEPDATDFAGFLADVGALAMGASTYEWVLAHERMIDHPDKWRAAYGDTPAWVFTHRDLPAIPGAHLHFVQGDVRGVHAEMVTAARGKNIWLLGGGELVGTFADHGLLDEIIVSIAPVTLGAGAPLLPRRLAASRLRLVDMSRAGAFAMLTYRVASP